MFNAAEYKTCQKCSQRGSLTDNFCGKCGGALALVGRKVYQGENPRKGIYRLTIVVEHEFRNRDHAEECAGKSCLGEEGGYLRDLGGVGGNPPIKVEFVRSTVTPQTHPFVCGTCIQSKNRYERENPPVAENSQGYCEWCDTQNWVPRPTHSHLDGDDHECFGILVNDECRECGYYPGDDA